MSKHAKLKRRRPSTAARRSAPASPTPPAEKRERVPTLDMLRGLAIALMIVDHISGILFSVNIEPSSIRFVTRLSMPLFAVLMGYFLDASRLLNWKRVGQIALAAFLVNAIYAPLENELEILASLLCAYFVFYGLKTKFAYTYLLIFLAPWDFTASLFDYPLAVVIPCVALGYILRQAGWVWGLVNSLLALAMLNWIEPPTQYALYFLTPAVLLVALAARFKTLRMPPLETLGRYPLTVYVTQYYVILACRYLAM